MTMDQSEGNLLFEAGQALLVKSGLVCWDDPTFTFAPRYQGDNDSEFEKWWKQTFHPKFGRYMAWAKAGQPPGTLGKCVNTLPALCKCRTICGERETILTAGYKLLLKIRNRDTHNYKANERMLNFQSVEKVFVPAFNILVETMKPEPHGGPPTK